MATVKDSLKLSGYSQEEAYFFELNRKLIGQVRVETARKKKRERAEQLEGASKEEHQEEVQTQPRKKAA